MAEAEATQFEAIETPEPDGHRVVPLGDDTAAFFYGSRGHARFAE